MDVLYSIPNMNQCKSCHVYNNIQQPIGPKVRNLNMDFVYVDGTMNQLEKWVSSGILDPLPDINTLPRTVNYSDNLTAHWTTVPGPGWTSTVPTATAGAVPLKHRGSTWIWKRMTLLPWV